MRQRAQLYRRSTCPQERVVSMHVSIGCSGLVDVDQAALGGTFLLCTSMRRDYAVSALRTMMHGLVPVSGFRLTGEIGYPAASPARAFDVVLTACWFAPEWYLIF